MVRRKSVEKEQESKTDTSAVLGGARAKKVLIGVHVDEDFACAVELAAKKLNLSKSNFVRIAIVRAVRDAGLEIDDSGAVSYRGQQASPKNDVLARAAGARAVRYSKKPETPEHVRRLELLALGYDEEAIGAYLYAKARAEKTVGRPLTPEEDEEFITSAAARAAEIKACNGGWGEGPPNL